MNADQLVSQALNVIKALLAIMAIVLGGMACWKIFQAGFNIDVKTSAEVAACFAITFYCLKQ